MKLLLQHVAVTRANFNFGVPYMIAHSLEISVYSDNLSDIVKSIIRMYLHISVFN